MKEYRGQHISHQNSRRQQNKGEAILEDIMADKY